MVVFETRVNPSDAIFLSNRDRMQQLVTELGERGLISEVRTGMGRCVSPQGRSRLERRLWRPASPAILTGARENPCLPSAGRQPAVELAKPVMAPEGLAIGEEEG